MHTMASKMVEHINHTLVTKKKNKVSNFNRNENENPYCIFFHDANPVNGHYKPFFYKKLSKSNFEYSSTYFSLM